MKVFRTGVAALAVGSVMLLGACGSEPSSAPGKDYLNTDTVAAMSCDKVDKVELQKAVDYVGSPTGQQTQAILRLNQGDTSLDPLKEALKNKATECGATPAPEIEGSGDPAPWPCPDNLKQNFDPNKGGNFASNGVTDTKDILALAGRDARYLGFIAHQSNLVDTQDPNPLLVPDNSCLSQKGQEIWNQLKGALTASGTSVDLNAQAPDDHYNTGMNNGQAVVDSQPGIGGDRSAIVYTFQNGSKLIILKRCANLALPSQGNLPKAETDHRRPPGKTVPPPTVSTCPPDMPHGTPPNCKDDPSRDPAQQGNAPDGNGSNTGTGERNIYTPPPGTPYQAPPPPARTTNAPPPVVQPTQPSGQQPTVVPPAEPTNTGSVVPTSGCGNPEFC